MYAASWLASIAPPVRERVFVAWDKPPGGVVLRAEIRSTGWPGWREASAALKNAGGSGHVSGIDLVR